MTSLVLRYFFFLVVLPYESSLSPIIWLSSFTFINLAEIHNIIGYVNGIIIPKTIICWKYTHPKAIRYVDEFVPSSQQIQKNSCSPTDPLQRMGVVIMRFKILCIFLSWFRWEDFFHWRKQFFQGANWLTETVWITCGLLWSFYQLFILSFWWHPFTAEDPLVSNW